MVEHPVSERKRFLTQKNISVETRVFANKEKINSQEAWKLMESASLILTGKGKKRQEWNPASDDKANILKDVIGPSGNLRAPTWRIGNEFIVGFNPELYEEVFG